MTNETKTVFDIATGLPVIIPLTDAEQADLVASRVQSLADKTARDATEAARQLDLAELATAKADAALIVITGDLTLINSDIAGLTAGTAVATLGRVLAREKKARQREQAIIKILKRLINQ